MPTFSFIWIKRDNEKEDRMIERTFQEIIKHEHRYVELPEIVLIGRTRLDLTHFKTEIPIRYVDTPSEWDRLGLICHKKNIGVRMSTGSICVVMHADVHIPEDTLMSLLGEDRKLAEDLKRQLVEDEHVVTPLGLFAGNRERRVTTWATLTRDDRAKPIEEPFDKDSYISGGVLMTGRHVLIRNGWDEKLGHCREEDVELSRRLNKKGYIQKCDPRIIVLFFNYQ